MQRGNAGAKDENGSVFRSLKACRAGIFNELNWRVVTRDEEKLEEARTARIANSIVFHWAGLLSSAKEAAQANFAQSSRNAADIECRAGGPDCL